MSSAGSTNLKKRQASETDKTQKLLNNDSAQHLKLRERRRFFEEVYQHDMDNDLPTAQLQIDHTLIAEGEEDDEDDEDAEVVYRECASLKRQNEPFRSSQSRISSTSSASSDSSASGVDTPVIQSDDEEVHADTLLLTSAPQTRDEESDDEEAEERYHLTNHDKA
ncbi:dysbindin-A-like [Neolamprologus brichardi]|uniref:dysbindin-A-like n=1 Tax=Neolamprologus brichardi TaxID=32507 RepID=UPI001643F4F0|nr:dysbindin-A-like [Neolamprologus brichardi]